jgi:AcrR family transcriptional regulator
MELRDRIIAEASLLFFNKGIKSVTMSTIANELGISKRTLYEVFKDKEDLLEICINDRLERIEKEMQTLFDNSDNVIDTLMRIYAKHLQSAQNVNKSVLYDLKKYHAHIYKAIENRQKESIHTLIPLLKRGVEQGLIRDDINFEIIIWLVKSQFKTLMDNDFIPTDKYSTNEFIRAIILNFMRGISTPSGSKKIDSIVGELKRSE